MKRGIDGWEASTTAVENLFRGMGSVRLQGVFLPNLVLRRFGRTGQTPVGTGLMIESEL